MESEKKLIVALDVFTFDEVKSIVESTTQEVLVYKVGLQLLTSEGPEVIRYLKSRGKSVFLDLKLHEISNSVATAVISAGNLGVDMITVHASGGQKMMQAAVSAAAEFPALKVLALTVVSGLIDQDLFDIGFSRSCQEQALRLARLAQQSGCHGVIASPLETKSLRQLLPKDMIIITPGVRLERGDVQDQMRVGTPADAIRSGATFIVVGRAITTAGDPGGKAGEINQILQQAKYLSSEKL